MGGSLAQLLQGWHDFYILIGTAAATLVGLMFVAASVGSSYFNVEREAALHAFLTPTVLHFTAVLVTCLVVIAPLHGAVSLGVGLACLSALGFLYAVRVWLTVHCRRFNIDLEDRLWYLVAPLTSYLIMAASAVLQLLQRAPELGLDLLAGALGLLMLLGIRNAWDMTTWVAVRTPSPPSPQD
jgi:hypothetical protein